MGVLLFERQSGRHRRRAGWCQVVLAGLLLPAPAARAVVVSCVRWLGADGGGCALSATAARTRVESSDFVLLWVVTGFGTGQDRCWHQLQPACLLQELLFAFQRSTGCGCGLRT